MSSSSTGVLAVARAAQVARLLAASTIGRIPLGAAPVALLLFARERWSIGAAGLLVGVYTVGLALGGPLLARGADRWRQPPVMVAAGSVSTVGFVVLATLPVPFAVAAVAALLAGAGAPPFEAGLRVLWRYLLPEEQVRVAYSLDIALQELIFILGPLVAVGAVAVGGTGAGLCATAACQLVGTVWFVSTPAVRAWRGERAERHWAGPLRSPALRLLLCAVLLVGAGIGTLPVAVTRFAEAAGDRSWSGWLLAANATGALVGGLVATRFAITRRHLPWLGASLALGYAPLLLTPAPVPMIGLTLLSGLSLPALLTATFVTVDEVAPAGTAAEAFAWVATAFTAGSAIGAAVDGAILDRNPAVAVGFVLAPVSVAAGAVLYRILAARLQ
ncbi:MFS transporter [Virgisporangium aliadipatigenens]|uniref:MFS transporter n=1 Tax=Virgisporangium aliadipatigenens TaxID=741659 RepID=A0A8J3YMJ9_9ACTN|nr:MFS transporter [Virgisporangium aliadipatigenens]GIJ48284.1 MFS transporter [Virgisporangium aliadipatigenens]